MSRLQKIELINFMSLPHAEFEFDDRGIICPVGYNDSGKSAVTRSLEVLWFDSYSQLQTKFITDGQNSFIIRNYFDDGILIQRTKYIDGRSHWLMQQNGTTVYTNQLANGSFAAIKGVPDAIRDYLSVCKDDATGEILNIRRNTNKLLLVATTGGENYKIFNNLCQGERLAYAVSEVNKDVNALNRSTTQKQARLLGMIDSLKSMQIFDEALESEIMQSSHALIKSTDQLAVLISAAEEYSSYANIDIIPELPIIDLSQLEFLAQIADSFTKSNVDILNPIPEIDISQLSALDSLKSQFEACNYDIVAPIPETDIAKFQALEELAAAYAKLKKCEDELQYGIEWLKNERSALQGIADANDWRVCKNCGEIVEKEAI